MEFPNATKGLRCLVAAQTVALVASLIAVLLSVIALPGLKIEEIANYPFKTIDIFFMVIVLVLYVAAYVLEVIGVILASKDEPAFKISLYAIIAGVILTVLAAFFYQNDKISYLISIGGDVARFFFVHYIIHGIMHLSEHLGKEDVSKRGSRIFIVIYIGIVFEIIVRVIEIIFGKEQADSIARPFDVIANILKSLEYILFMIYIVRGNRMLRKAQADS